MIERSPMSFEYSLMRLRKAAPQVEAAVETRLHVEAVDAAGSGAHEAKVAAG